MKKQRIAIIGGGAAGAITAWKLKDIHEVAIFENEPQLGGHAYTHHIPIDREIADIDMGVEYFTERLSPNFCAILDLLCIQTYVAPYSVRVTFPGADNSWSSIHGKGKLRSVLEEELDRFHLAMVQVMTSGDERYKKMSIAQYLEENGYSTAFQCQALLPIMTTFSGCNAPSLDYSLMYVATSFNMHLLSFYSSGYWRKAKGGIDAYLSKIGADLGGRVRTNNRVLKVTKKPEGRIEVATAKQPPEMFDQVVFATHADITLALIESPSQSHRDILGAFEYVPVRSVLHSDSSILTNGGSGEYCEFRMGDEFDLAKGLKQYGQLTRVNNNLRLYSHIKRPLLVTFDPKVEIAPDKILKEQRWKLPKLRPADFYRKTRIRELQGVENMWFCGTDTSLTGHEGALVSGLVIAERLGAEYPFPNNVAARVQFRVIKDMMGVKRNSETFQRAMEDVLFKISRFLPAQSDQRYRFIKEMIM
jgi:predicted NAD/FAD-binding protein